MTWSLSASYACVSDTSSLFLLSGRRRRRIFHFFFFLLLLKCAHPRLRSGVFAREKSSSKNHSAFQRQKLRLEVQSEFEEVAWLIVDIWIDLSMIDLYLVWTGHESLPSVSCRKRGGISWSPRVLKMHTAHYSQWTKMIKKCLILRSFKIHQNPKLKKKVNEKSDFACSQLFVYILF